MTVERPLVLIASDYYPPGYKGGGSLRTLVNVVDQLGDEFRFRVLTLDRDLGDAEPYPEVTIDSWQSVGKAEVLYLAPRSTSLRSLRKIIRTTEHHLLYLNSFFSPTFTIKPLLLRRLKLVPRVPLILAPRGEFSPDALMLKRLKKRTYLALAKALGLYRGIIWQASNEYEKSNIRHWFGAHVPVVVVPDLLAPAHAINELSFRREKIAGCLKVVFLSRISRMKNLDGALRILKGLKSEIQFNIYGPLEDIEYWAECQQIIDLLPHNIRVQYRGGVSYERVADIMADHDLFFLPTLGENFGHAIMEALLAGCPVLLSNRTPWRGLANEGVGWDLPLDRPELFQAALQQCVEMTAQDHQAWSRRARAFGIERARNQTVIQQNRGLLHRTISGAVY